MQPTGPVRPVGQLNDVQAAVQQQHSGHTAGKLCSSRGGAAGTARIHSFVPLRPLETIQYTPEYVVVIVVVVVELLHIPDVKFGYY